MCIFVFWLSVFLIIHTNILYPVIIFILMVVLDFKKSLAYLLRGIDYKDYHKKAFYPKVTVVVPAYNEGRVIEKKIKNFFELDYPKDKLEMLIGSDGSTDDTGEKILALSAPNVRLLKFPRRGKASTINDLIKEARGDVIVLSDAAASVSPASIKNLTRHFGSPDIGCVRGEIKMESKKGTREEDMYMRFETLLKRGESKLDIVLGASGAIFAIKKELFDPLPEDTINDDFLIPMKIREKGYSVIYEPEATAYEEPPKGLEVEFWRRVRISAGVFQLLKMTKGLLNPKRGRIAFVYFSHKILRWFCPYLLLLAFLSNLIIFKVNLFYKLVFALQVIFYTLAVVGYTRRKMPRPRKVFSSPFYFVYFNIALMLGNMMSLTKRYKKGWEKTAR